MTQDLTSQATIDRFINSAAVRCTSMPNLAFQLLVNDSSMPAHVARHKDSTSRFASHKELLKQVCSEVEELLAIAFDLQHHIQVPDDPLMVHDGSSDFRTKSSLSSALTSNASQQFKSQYEERDTGNRSWETPELVEREDAETTKEDAASWRNKTLPGSGPAETLEDDR
ncbi:hypothetical protein NDU88_002697 [Pleurodeles waltl]|uniref:Uncharacterized protein n=1 Tax=Pleurodeles waltl TaxID=8319 RepID=A0AAV7SFR3_PLEWA|nr:hypothetical protein NDU88_002697 [Pleurodeles waltl]